jgi:hypothetical protein
MLAMKAKKFNGVPSIIGLSAVPMLFRGIKL